MLEQSCVVWHSAITQEETADLERVQKEYETYEQALEITGLVTLQDRRSMLCETLRRNV